jgi:hypothetical protein
MFIDDREIDIGLAVSNFFDAVRKKWPEAWNFKGRGRMLNRSNGFGALMRFLRYSYLDVGQPGDVPSATKFYDISFRPISLRDDDFTIETRPRSEG